MTMPTVDIAGIERELRQLWKASAVAATGGQAVTRALTLNLVARAHDDAMAAQINAVAQQLTTSHPHRAVLAIMRPPAATPRLEAFVQANCLLSAPGVPQVCGEQITIDADGPGEAQVASLVLALLVPDLPVALWLPGPAPLDDPLLARLRRVSNRLIVDTREAADPARALATMAAYEAAAELAALHSPALSDLGWATLTPLRELTAQFFDTRPLLPHLRRIDEVTISYLPARSRAGLALGLLLAGWLAACLGWVALDQALSIEEGTVRLHLRRPAVGCGPHAIRLVTIDLRPASGPADAAPGVTALRLRAVDGVRADFHVERDDDTHAQTTAHVAGMPPVSRMARCVTPTLADLLAAELRLLSRDQTFAAALRVAGAFAARLPAVEL
jgi:glucose-6-phosphate dehydrogenase assembly protein OpcA